MTTKRDEFDVVIIGGGPAGMSAALWCDDLGLASCLIERNRVLGGQLHWISHKIENYIGTRFEDGEDCFEHFSASLKNRRFECITGYEVAKVDPPSTRVTISNGRVVRGKAILVATGIRRRTLGIPGEAEFYGKGILNSGSKHREQVSGRSVAVIGGGDAAVENALILSEHADRLYLIHRRDEFTARREFVDSILSNSKIEKMTNWEVQRFGGDSQLQFIEIMNLGGKQTRIEVENAVVRIGVEPNTQFLTHLIEMDPQGYIRVDHEGRTSVASVYAVGDVANRIGPTISSAVGSAATAVKSIAKFIRENE